MLCKKIFMRDYTMMLTAKGIALDKTAAMLTYEAFKNDFTDEQFSALCIQIFKTENFYGRVPDASIFSKYIASKTDDFIAKCYAYLESGYISVDDKKLFLSSLSEPEQRALGCVGGISAAYSSCRPNGVYRPDKVDFKINQIKNALSNANPPYNTLYPPSIKLLSP